MNGRAKSRASSGERKAARRGARALANGSKPGANTKARASVGPKANDAGESPRRRDQRQRASKTSANAKASVAKASESRRRPGQKHGNHARAYLDGHPHAALLDELVRRAKAVRANAYAPYSRYLVGAAIATKSGRIFEGCNVENASFGATICAERGAIMQMIAAGEREPIACAVVTGDEQGAAPCGICRQVLAEFGKELSIALVGVGSPEGDSGRVVHLRELLPLMFELRR